MPCLVLLLRESIFSFSWNSNVFNFWFCPLSPTWTTAKKSEMNLQIFIAHGWFSALYYSKLRVYCDLAFASPTWETIFKWFLELLQRILLNVINVDDDQLSKPKKDPSRMPPVLLRVHCVKRAGKKQCYQVLNASWTISMNTKICSNAELLIHLFRDRGVQQLWWRLQNSYRLL